MSQTADNKHVKPVNQRRCRDEITIVLANCDRVTGKKSSIENMLVSLDPDIFLAVETKLDNTVQNGEILLPQYNSSPNDRKRGGGGVLVASKDNIITEALPDYDTNCELCWIKIHLEGAKTLIVGVLYWPPDSPRQCLHELSLSLTRIRVKYPDAILMLGDFNLPGIDWQSMSHVPSRPKKAESELLLSTIQDFHMDQLNTEPTRGSSILELVLSSCPELVTSCTTGPDISDHDHLVIVRASVVLNRIRRSLALYIFSVMWIGKTSSHFSGQLKHSFSKHAMKPPQSTQIGSSSGTRSLKLLRNLCRRRKSQVDLVCPG